MATRSYHAFVSVANTVSTTVPMWNLTGSAATQIRLQQIIIGSSVTPVDVATRFVIRRTSSGGTTSTTVTPNPTNSVNTTAAVGVFATAWSGNPTITANSDLLWIPMNGKSTVIWTPPLDLFVMSTPTAGHGLALLSAVASTTQAYDFGVFWTEE